MSAKRYQKNSHVIQQEVAIREAILNALDQEDEQEKMFYYNQAIELTVRLYQSEIFSFLCSVMSNPVDAEEAFGTWAEMLVLSLSRFKIRGSIRTFSYCLARKSIWKVRRWKKMGSWERLQTGFLSNIIDRKSFQTLGNLSVTTEKNLSNLSQFSEEELTLISLYVDRRMSWQEVMEIMIRSQDHRDSSSVQKEAKRLYEVFTWLKLKLKLSDDERNIYYLRIQENLSWHETAERTLTDNGNRERDLKAETQRVRKVFQRLVVKLRGLAAELKINEGVEFRRFLDKEEQIVPHPGISGAES